MKRCGILLYVFIVDGRSVSLGCFGYTHTRLYRMTFRYILADQEVVVNAGWHLCAFRLYVTVGIPTCQCERLLQGECNLESVYSKLFLQETYPKKVIPNSAVFVHILKYSI